MGETEVRTADSSGTVQNASSQSSKAKGKGRSGARAGARKTVAQKLNARGVPVTQWDVPENDPNLRKHVGESPDGEGNKLK